ncbi:hypothetical protein [Phaeovulum vinaykumarii]|uniref:Lipoprotein n=1 Tax=Phaeovulum vinaykumarii TaxID=407234 RepID=A0A1N7KUV4_9RHOB|nr:hypothetical protein [Phaeovulum vinaykumarii]SIS65190.1 hypothetical protein SAMN05421795_102176 [Phaeovulum vinaykumarii]SOC01370.1 hypothetical protein SAMN05878426_102598 [Phaeovulum vinaykumarii]
MRAAAALLMLVLALAGCREGAGGAAPGLPADPAAQCARQGGAWRELASGPAYCEHRTRDAGKACRSASDCEGACLARSQTCAPLRPLLGCNAILSDAGFEMRECLE